MVKIIHIGADRHNPGKKIKTKKIKTEWTFDELNILPKEKLKSFTPLYSSPCYGDFGCFCVSYILLQFCLGILEFNHINGPNYYFI